MGTFLNVYKKHCPLGCFVDILQWPKLTLYALLPLVANLSQSAWRLAG